MTQIETRYPSRWRIVGWGGAAALLTVPFVAMFFTTEVSWTISDFVIAAMMLGILGLLIELAVRASGNWFYRGGAMLAALSGFLLFWANGAVGVLGDEGNPANLMFLGVIGFAILASAVAGFRASGMAWAMFTAAALQTGASLFGLAMGWASPGTAGLYEVALGIVLFAGLWVLSGALFRRAAREA